MLEPDRDQIEIFVDAIFRHAKAGVVSLRAFYEGEDKVFRIEPVPTNATNFYKYLCDVAEDIARRAAQDPKPVVFCPPLATFREKKGAAEADLVEGYTLSVECDENPDAARAKLEPLLGPVTVAVRSGGIWQSNGAAYDKQHLHWRLAKPATGKEQLAKLKRAREIACHLVGADPTTAPICHPLRWPGSWHRKAEPRPCEIIAEASNFDHEIDLDDGAGEARAVRAAASAGGRQRRGRSERGLGRACRQHPARRAVAQVDYRAGDEAGCERHGRTRRGQSSARAHAAVAGAAR